MPSLDLSLPSVALGLVVLKATLLLGAAFIGALLLQRAAAGARHLLWVASIGALLCLPALSAWSPLRLSILPAPAVERTESTPIAAPIESSAPSVPTNVALPTPAGDRSRGERVVTPASVVNTPESSQGRRISGWWMLLGVWGVVAGLLGAWLILSFLAVARVVRRATVLADRAWSAPLYEIADRLGIDRTPHLVKSDEVRMPFAAGILRPTIVLPAECEGWSEERRRAVLMHELAHIKRRDLLGHTLGRIACAIYWFHPLVWSATRRLRIESERACDDLALTSGLRATTYAEHLLDIVSGIRQPRTPAIAIPMADRKEFEGRMLAILDPEVRRRPGRAESRALLGVLAMLVFVVGAAAPVPRQGVASAEAPDPSAPLTLGDRASVDDDSAPAHVVKRTEQGSRTDERVERRTEVRRESQSASVPNPIARPSGANAPAVTGASSAPEVDVRIENDAVRALVRTAIATRGDTLGQKAGDERATLLLQVLRADTSAELRRVAAWGLENYSNRAEVARALAITLRQDRSASVRETAAWALANAGGGVREVVDALIEALRRDTDDSVRESAAWALGEIEAESARDALVAALTDRAPAVRTHALWALGNAGEGKAPRAVIDALADSSKRVRYLAAWTLYNMEDAAAVPALESALNRETEKSLRTAYIRALGAIGGESAATLARLLDSKDAELRAAVVGALAGRNGAPWPMPMPRPRPYP